MEVDTGKKVCWNAAATKACQEVTKSSQLLRSASKTSHAGGIQRRLVLSTVGAFARLFTSVLNRTTVYNKDTLLDLVQSRPSDTPLVTVSNHMSTLDDPLMWGMKGLPITDPKLSRWTLTAEDICFTNPIFSYFFRLGKCLPVRRGAGIHQPYMDEALDVINRGDWLHTFPEGKLSQEEGPMRRLKWGTASLIARASVQPIVLPIAHSGYEKVLPENYMFGRRPLLPLPMKRITIVVGEPMVFDIPQLKLIAKSVVSRGASETRSSVPHLSGAGRAGSREGTNSVDFSSPHFDDVLKERFVGESSAILEEKVQRWMYSHMSENLRCLLQDLALKAKVLNAEQG
ncbi:monolysocardiolipin acyltransferase [Marchantia polymorpha subsp. ruderalis]|uniref:Tafazzin family protein n=2 Tax=Marchantia polymorpha TaxID=3197 RepID=A0AAF6AXP0_MARPO|nr:hypothetical protein MARPO_0006s0012 [Marchantia polymorpha]PTQ47961.1 hypothetical protein MARPO_0006s0012 [Marchantia polymorpha]BBN04524.1 hypothetical protein Mp_3g05390 [Marchantia polymorpha subsp. ruderalis]BBN04525.1 hypothetical protein Mp_3g05390 [Marchantia polymorpha subsp. ruderalis]|eukprot:PTQ47960.1 hypothetical protein MARPO_0006s0012 [Marchantia polymorpha]